MKLATLAEVDPGHLSRIENGKAGFSENTIRRIAGALMVDMSTLYSSSGNVEYAPPELRRVPVLDYVQAGQWRAVQEGAMEGEIAETIPVNLDVPPSVFALRVRGDSMQPRFSEGDIVIISPVESPKPKNFVVAVDENGEATFKQYREVGRNESGHEVFELVPLNPFYKPLRSDRQKLTIVGVMIEHRSFQRT